MKKYWGKSEWPDTPYLWIPESVFRELYVETHRDLIDDDLLGWGLGIPYGVEEHGFPDNNYFTDMNDFSKYPEGFNVYQEGKI